MSELRAAVDAYAKPLAGQMSLFDESAHPRASQGSPTGGQFVAGHHGAKLEVPESGGRYGLTAEVVGGDADNVHLHSQMGKAIVPRSSMAHFHGDITGDFSHLRKHGSSGNKHVDAVINGQATLMGRGNDSVVHKVGDKIVKSSTILPYHPMTQQGYMTPDEASWRAVGQNQTIESMRAAGVTGIPEQHEVKHGDKVFTVREYLEIPKKLTAEQLSEATEHLRSLHAAGYATNDQLQFGISKDGSVKFFDLGAAAKDRGMISGSTDSDEDRTWLRRMHDDAGVPYGLQGEELERKAKSWARILQRQSFDDFSPERAEQFRLFQRNSSLSEDWGNYFEAARFGMSNDEIAAEGLWVPQEMYSLTAAIESYAKPLAGQMGFNFDEEAHPRSHKGSSTGGQFVKKSAVDNRYAEWSSRRHRLGDSPTSFLSGHSGDGIRAAAKENAGIGLLITPLTPSYISHIADYSHIALDNGVYSEFTGSAPFNRLKFMEMLDRVAAVPGAIEKTQFVVAPDRIGDWQGTIERSKPFFAEIRKRGFPVAFAAQDGIEDHLDEIPWDEFDVLFIGGSTPWKMGFDPNGQYENHSRPKDDELRKAGMLRNHVSMIKEAKRRGKKIHMGRVNSFKRMEMANYGMNVNTVDGNYIGVAPDKNLKDVIKWLESTGGDMFEKPAEKKPTTDEKRGPAGLTRHEAIKKAMGDSTRSVMNYKQAVTATWHYIGGNPSDWDAVPVDDMVESEGRMMPQFDMPAGYKHVETPHTSESNQCCELCGTSIKNNFYIKNDKDKLTMTVGSECVRGFGEGLSGEQQAKKDMHDNRRDLVRRLHEAIREFSEHTEKAETSWGEKKHRRPLTLADVAKEIGNKDIRMRFWKVGRSLGIYPHSSSWSFVSGKAVTHEPNYWLHNHNGSSVGESSNQKIANWHKKYGEDAESVIKDLNGFMGKPSLDSEVQKYAMAFNGARVAAAESSLSDAMELYAAPLAIRISSL